MHVWKLNHFILIIFNSLFFVANTWGIYEPLKGIRQIIIPRVNCPYEDVSSNVLSINETTRSSLQALQSAGQECIGVAQKAGEVEKKLDEYFDYQRRRMGITGRGEGSTLEINCENYVQLYRWEYNNAMADTYASRKIHEDNFFGNIFTLSSLPKEKRGNMDWEDCNQLILVEEDGDLKYSPEFYRCTEDALVKRLRWKREECELEHKKVSTTQMLQELQKDIEIQQTVGNSVRDAMRSIYTNLSSENCFASEAIMKAAVQSTVSLGANIAGSVLGGSMGGAASSMAVSVGAEAINFAVEYLSRQARELSKISDMERNENFENAACMFFNVQETDCAKYEISKDIKVCREKSPEELRDEERLAVNTKDIYTFIDDYAQKIKLEEIGGPGVVKMLKNTLKKFEIKHAYPLEKEATLRQIMNRAAHYWLKVENHKDFQQLAKYREALWKSDGLLNDWNSRFVSVRPKSFDKYNRKEITYMYKLQEDITQNLKTLFEPNLPNLLRGFIRQDILDTQGINRLLAEETAREIVQQLDESKIRTEGDLRKLADLTSAMVEGFKESFRDRIKFRYRESIADGFRYEINYMKKFGLDRKDTTFDDLTSQQKSEVKKERQNTFRMLRNTLKDCLATSGVMYMNRKRQKWYYINFFQGAANLLIKRIPKTYLKVCSPFMCDGPTEAEQGIPIPRLPSNESAPSDFGKYQCRLISNARNIYDRLEKNYIETGKICGKTITQITKGGKNFKSRRNDIASLKRLITRPVALRRPSPSALAPSPDAKASVHKVRRKGRFEY